MCAQQNTITKFLPMYNSYRHRWVCSWFSWLWCECQLFWHRG